MVIYVFKLIGESTCNILGRYIGDIRELGTASLSTQVVDRNL